MENSIGILDALSVPALLWDAGTGQIRHVNSPAGELLTQLAEQPDIDARDFYVMTSVPAGELLVSCDGGARPLVSADVLVRNDGGLIFPLSGWVYFPYDMPDKEDVEFLVFLPTASLNDDARRMLRSIRLGKKNVSGDAEGARRTSELGLVRQIIDAFPGMVFIKDVSGRYIGCSDAFARFVSLNSTEDILGKTSFEVLPRASAEWATRLDNLMFDKLQPTSEIYPFSMEDEALTNWQRVSRSPLRDEDGRLIGLIGTLESVDNIMKLTEELTMSKARFMALSDIMSYNSFIVILWNVDNLAVSYMSDSVTYLGYRASHFSGMTDWEKLVHPDDLAEFRRLRFPLLQKHLHIDFWHEYRMVSRTGEVRWMQERVMSVMAPGSHLYRSLIIDTTARHERDNISLSSGDSLSLQSESVHLLDIVSREYLQERSDHVSKALGLSSFILDTAGAPLTERNDMCTLCSMIRSSERGETLCRLSEVNTGIAARDAGGLICSTCENLGLHIAAAPLMMGERHMGTWIIGLSRAGGTVDESHVRALCGKLRMDEEQAVAAFNSMPELETEQLYKLFNLLPPYVQEVSDFVQRSYMMMYETEKMVKSQDALSRGGEMDSLITELFDVFFRDERDAGARLIESFQILCEYFGFDRAIAFERLGGNFGISGQWARRGLKPVDSLHYTVSDVRDLASLAKPAGSVAQLFSYELPSQWHSLCQGADADKLLFRVIENNGRPSAVILFTNSGERPMLHADELYSLNQLIAPMTAFILTRQSERRMHQSASSLQLIINSLRSAVYVIDRSSYEVLFSNDHFDGRMIVGSRGLPCFRLLGKDSPCSCCALDMMKDKPDGYTYTYETDEKIPGCWHSIAMTAITWPGDRPVYLVRVRDITEEKHQQEQLMYAATFDILLDIPTIGRLNARLSDLLMSPNNFGYLFVIEIDNVQLINNAYGHLYGDALLLEIVAFLKSITPKDGYYVYRYATGVFAVMLENANREHAEDFKRRLFERFEASWQIKDKLCFSTFSAGMVRYGESSHTLVELMRNADLALSRSVDRARNSFFFAENLEYLDHADRLELANDLHAMVADGCKDMVVQYQPVYDFNKGRVTHCEAFMRWRHPVRGLIQPLMFLDIAEHTSLIIPLSISLIEQVLRQCRRWLDDGVDIGVSVNFSAAHSRQEGVLEQINDVLKSSGLSPNRLQIELSETITLDDRDYTLSFMKKLRNMGCLVAIDNFGTDLSSLNDFDSNPVDVIKIDRDFVGDVCENAYHAAVIAFAVNAARICGLQVTCKGIENREQLEKVREMGVDHIQGFYLSRPVDGDNLTGLLLSNPKF